MKQANEGAGNAAKELVDKANFLNFFFIFIFPVRRQGNRLGEETARGAEAGTAELEEGRGRPGCHARAIGELAGGLRACQWTTAGT